MLADFFSDLLPSNARRWSGNLAKVLLLGADDSPIHRQAIVSDTICPGQPGRAYFEGSCWPALCQQKVILLPGTRVYVIEIDNITLLVEPAIATSTGDR
jgi:membrane protein implicated in regulation of membrane protease activity